jgi:hypothetical protein
MDDVEVPAPWHHLHRLLRELGRVALVRPTNEAWLSIEQDHVLSLIERGDGSWQSLVPEKAADIIASRRLFRRDCVAGVPVGCTPSAVRQSAEPPSSSSVA